MCMAHAAARALGVLRFNVIMAQVVVMPVAKTGRGCRRTGVGMQRARSMTGVVMASIRSCGGQVCMASVLIKKVEDVPVPTYLPSGADRRRAQH